MTSAWKDDGHMGELSKRYATDDTFREVANLLFGAGGDELVSKMSPGGSDLHISAADKKKKSERTQARVAFGTNVIGIGAGVAGTHEAIGGLKRVQDKKRGKVEHTPRHYKVSRFKELKSKYAIPVAAGALGLQTLNLAGDAVANRVLSRAAKAPKGAIKAVSADVKNVKDKTKKMIHKRAGGSLSLMPEVSKRQPVEMVWEGEISKLNIDKQQVFGWASIVEKNGEKIVDLQGDYISIDEVEKSGYEYVIKSRKGGDMHLRDGDKPVQASDLIESFIVTPEKREALGLPETVPTGWWVGYQVNDPDVWGKIKSGERTGFSIHGRGMRTPLDD